MSRAGRALRRLRDVPRPLAGLLVAVAVFGIAWALMIPPLEGPDEIQHFSYVETLGQHHSLPGQTDAVLPERRIHDPRRTATGLAQYLARHAAPGHRAASSALVGLLQAMNGDSVTVGLGRPEQSRVAFARWRRDSPRQTQHDGGGTFPGSNYPPLYYALDAVGYSLAIGGDVLDHLYAARLASVLFLLLTTVGVWMLAGELSGRQRPVQLLAAAAVGLWPMISFVSSMVNPDALLYAAWTWTFWAMAVIVRRGLTVARLLGLAGLAVAAVLTKETSIALLPSVALVIGAGLWRLRRRGDGSWRRPAAALGLLVGLPVLALAGLTVTGHLHPFAQANEILSGGIGNVREFFSYVWEYYLPRLPGQRLHDYYIPTVSTYPAYAVWVASGWGAFGWVTIFFPKGFYPWFLAITVLVGVGGVSRVVRNLWRTRREPPVRGENLVLLAAFGLSALLLLAGLHLTEFKLQSPTNQGRYLFPLAGLAGVSVALATRWLPLRLRAAATGAVVGALAVFEIASLGYVVTTFYA